LKLLMRENIRSGRKANFYITENSFIDNYAKAVGPMCAVVYNVLERFMNSETRSTWVGTAKIAEVVGATQRTVQRNLKTLEEFRLIKILRTPSATTYVVLPVPPKPKDAAIPLFDGVDDQDILWRGDTSVAGATSTSYDATDASYFATPGSQYSDTSDTPNKEEQDFLNKTKEQENKNTFDPAQRVVRALKLPNNLLSAARAAVDFKASRTKLSLQGVVNEIVTEAHNAMVRGGSKEDFVLDFLARALAQQILQDINLPVTNSLIGIVGAAVKAESKDADLSLEGAATLITNAAIDGRGRGIVIDRFYFEGVKWRPNVRVSKAEQRTLNNLEVNARVKQRLRERVGTS
jgi:hypothetical protein